MPTACEAVQRSALGACRRTSPSRHPAVDLVVEAAAGPFDWWSTFWIASLACSWSSRSIVVVTSRPLPKTRSAPYSAYELAVT